MGDTTTYTWYLNSWTLPVTTNKRISGITVWLADVDKVTAFMPGSLADTDLDYGMYNPFIEDCGGSYSIKRHYKG
ncbi:MAG: hypothetical protein QF704_03035 [Anaerolineales bacterium]|nr:hypothetical protein [Anaerolineales bacterium]MDP6769654.1 hypothetical protein [Anaerolineales bacterium]